MNESRRDTRYSYRTRIRLETANGSILEGMMSNFSLGGTLVETEPLPVFGEKVKLRVVLPGVPDECVIPCFVRWIKEDEGVGLQFESLRPIEVWALNKLKRALAAYQSSGQNPS